MIPDKSPPSVGKDSQRYEKRSSTETTKTINEHLDYTESVETSEEPHTNAVDIKGNLDAYYVARKFYLYFCDIAAKKEYNDLKSELSHISRTSFPSHKLEEGKTNSEVFNLDEYLNGLRQSQDSAGHTLKNLGVIWKDLTVKVRKLTCISIKSDNLN